MAAEKFLSSVGENKGTQHHSLNRARNEKSTTGVSLKAAECRAARPAERSDLRVWDTSQRAETAGSGNAGNRRFEPLYIQRHCSHRIAGRYQRVKNAR